MVRIGLLDINQHANKWSWLAETSSEVHRWKSHIELDNTSSHFSSYGQNTTIHELGTLGCYIYTIPSSAKTLEYRT